MRLKPALDLGNDVHDMGIALDRHQLRGVHGAIFADAAQVIARQIDQHDVLGAFLRIGEELAFKHQIGGRVKAARPCAGDRAEQRLPPLQADVHLGRRANQAQRLWAVQVGEIEEEHVGRGVQPPQRPVDVERLGRGLPAEAL